MATDPDLHARLRLEVGRFRARERRTRHFDMGIHVGSPDGPRESVVLPARHREYVDRAVRIELFSALLEMAPESSDCAWLTRPGPVVVEADDVGWLAPVLGAFGSAGRDLTGFYVVTRHGWVDVSSGERRVWKRLRIDR